MNFSEADSAYSTPISFRILLSCYWTQRLLEYRSTFYHAEDQHSLGSFISISLDVVTTREHYVQCLLVFFLQDYGSLCLFIYVPHITAPVWSRPVTSSFTIHSWGAVSCHDKSDLIVHLPTRGHPSADKTSRTSFLFNFFFHSNLTKFTVGYLVHTLLTQNW